MFQKLLQQLRQFLRFYGISIECTDIFEETLLRLAEIPCKPTQCRFSQADHGNKIEFVFWGISEEEANLFAAWLQHKNIPDITYQFSDQYYAYYILAPTEPIFNLLPLFQNKIIEMAKYRHGDLLRYQKQSSNSLVVKERNLLEKLDTVIANYSWIKKSTDQIKPYFCQSSCYQELIKLRTILYENESYGKQLDAISLFCKVARQNQSWLNNANIKSLYISLNDHYTNITLRDYHSRKTHTTTHHICANIFLKKFFKASSTLKQVSKHHLAPAGVTLPQEVVGVISAFLINYQYCKEETQSNAGYFHKEKLTVGACQIGQAGQLIYPDNLTKEKSEEFWHWAHQMFLLFQAKPMNVAAINAIKEDNPKLYKLLS